MKPTEFPATEPTQRIYATSKHWLCSNETSAMTGRALSARLPRRSRTQLLAGSVALAMAFCSSLGWATVVTVGGGASVTCPAVPTATYTTPPTGVSFGNGQGAAVLLAPVLPTDSGSGFNTADAATSFSETNTTKSPSQRTQRTISYSPALHGSGRSVAEQEHLR